MSCATCSLAATVFSPLLLHLPGVTTGGGAAAAAAAFDAWFNFCGAEALSLCFCNFFFYTKTSWARVFVAGWVFGGVG